MRIYLVILLFMVVSCGNSPKVEALDLLNGYWEIREVTFPDGQQKEYNINPIVDYYFYEENKGYKKKVKPKMDGTFTDTNTSEEFVITEDKGTYWMEYKNEFSKREDQLILLNNKELLLRSNEGVEYLYIKYDANKTHRP